MNTKNFRNELVLVLAVSLQVGAVCSPQLTVSLVKDPARIKLLGDAIVANNKESALVSDQVLLVQESTNRFFVAPFISTDMASGGCYVQTATIDNKLTTALLLASNEDAATCASVIALFGCKLEKRNGIGVIYGMRLGAGNYYTEGSLFEIARNGDLEENPELSRKIGTDSSVATAKNKIGCLK